MKTETFDVVHPRAVGAAPAAGTGRGPGQSERPQSREHPRGRWRARSCELLFLPPYSPDFTPIEQAFSKIKAILRGLGARTQEALQEAVRLAVEAITRADAAAWFAHAGYPYLLHLSESCSKAHNYCGQSLDA